MFVSIPRLESSDILSMDEVQQEEVIDETGFGDENGAREEDEEEADD